MYTALPPKIKISSALIWLGCALFTGVIIFSIGIGAAVPAIHRIAAPLVCPNGVMMQESDYYAHNPTETVITRAWFCVDNTSGDAEEITFKAVLVAGVIYGILFYLIYFAIMLVLPRRYSAADLERILAEQPRAAPLIIDYQPPINEEDPLQQRLARLKEMRNADLITAEEYAQKKAEILKEL
jgi:hypothetical protein